MTVKLKNLIERIFTKKSTKIILSLFIIIWFFVWTSFADSVWISKTDIVWRFTYVLNIIISILSWGRIILASLAWKLMTNELVYWTFLNLDKVLWNLWNIVKNFANFVLWFILLFSIVKNIFTVVKSDGNPLKSAINTVKNVLIAGILVQMSWFLVGVTLDLSTVATAVVWSIPSQIISNNSSNLERNLNSLIESKQVKLEVDFDKSDITQSTHTWELNEDDLRRFIDTITPSANSVIWPLIFLGGSVFDLFETSDTSYLTSDSLTWGGLFLTLWVNWFVIISFTVMMAFIFLFNLFRVITLWIIIPLSPFIILMKVFNPKGENLKIEWFMSEVLSLKNVFSLIFKPVYMVLVLSIILIVMTIVKWLVKSNNGTFTWGNFGNVNITSTKMGEGDSAVYDSSLNVDWFLKLTLNGTKNTIVDLMVYILWLILMFMLMKSCITSKTGISFIDNKMNSISESLWWKSWEFWWFLWSLWVVPIWNWKVWINNMRNFREKVLNDWTAWARAAGVDFARQDELIEGLMWWSSFKSLINSPSKKDWIESAVAIWKSKWYSSFTTLSEDVGFKNARSAWNANRKNRDSSKLIDIDDVSSAWSTWKFEESPSNNSPEGESEWWDDSQNAPQS